MFRHAKDRGHHLRRAQESLDAARRSADEGLKAMARNMKVAEQQLTQGTSEVIAAARTLAEKFDPIVARGYLTQWRSILDRLGTTVLGLADKVLNAEGEFESR